MKDLSQLAQAVIAQVDAAEVVKEAGVTYNKPQSYKTELGQGLLKLAERIREASEGKITYTDLARFRKNYGV